MIARATGAFVLVFVLLGYLFGNFNSDRDLLVAAAIAALVAVLIAIWLRPGKHGEGEPGLFDERATRRAVRRGVIRTAFVAVVWVVAASIFLTIASGLWQSRGDRRDHFAEVAGYGFFAAHPGFRWTGRGSCCNTDLRWSELLLTLDPKVASPIAQTSELKLRLDLRGRLRDPPYQVSLPKTGLDAVSSSPDKASLRKRLDALPASVVATAIVELRRPLDVSTVYELLARHQITYPDSGGVAVYLQSMNATIVRGPSGTFADERVSWPNPAVAGFQSWVKHLHGSDNNVLDGVGLPSVSVLRHIAERPKIYGFVLDHAPPRRLIQFLADPRVSMVRVGDAAFNLPGQSG
ncbi:MAG: hypothetical protein QOH23_414 [Gaiellaceae bacterium]|nr:hypothetical protein [Gaiellaceae bacterium]